MEEKEEVIPCFASMGKMRKSRRRRNDGDKATKTRKKKKQLRDVEKKMIKRVYFIFSSILYFIFRHIL